MIEGNKTIVRSVQSAAEDGVVHTPPRVTHVSKSSKSFHQSFKNNTRPTQAKFNKIIRVKIRPSPSTVPNDIIENSLPV